MHLWKSLNGKVKIIGVAKQCYQGSNAVKLIRQRSRRPLYITSAGMEPDMAAGLISAMHGNYRLPTLLRQADSLSRLSVVKKEDQKGLEFSKIRYH